MGLYAKYVFPWILERLEGAEIHALRARCVEGASGDVLEIGLGTGKTLPHYTQAVHHLTAIEPHIEQGKPLRERMKEVTFPVEFVTAAAESIPFEENRFDHVVVSLVFCSVVNPQGALGEIHRVLRPGGQLHFLEHVASETPHHREWQERLNWLQKIIGCGCNLNRPTSETVRACGFDLHQEERVISKEMPIWPELFPLVLGTATKV